jgi:hypothetical protein
VKVGPVGNGGLSFRKRSAVLEILEPLGEDPNPEGVYEDAFLIERMRQKGMKIADVEVLCCFLLIFFSLQ